MNRFSNIVWTAVLSASCAVAAVVLAIFEVNSGLITALSATSIAMAVLSPK